MNEAWRNLCVGHRIRITHIPPEFLRPNYTFHEDTKRLYEHLIASRRILTVGWIDEHETPWVEYEWKTEDGEIEYHCLAIDDNSWELVSDDGRKIADR